MLLARCVRLAVLGVVASACSQPSGTFASDEAPPPASVVAPSRDSFASAAARTAVAAGAMPAARGPVLATLATHDAKIWILGGGDDLRVSVQKPDGAFALDGATLAELRAYDPGLHGVVTSAVAAKGTYLDARLDAPTKRTALPGARR